LVRALTNKLDQARGALDRARPDLAAVHIAAFTAQVSGLQAGGHLSAAQASALMETADAIAAAVTAPCTAEAAPRATVATPDARRDARRAGARGGGVRVATRRRTRGADGPAHAHALTLTR